MNEIVNTARDQLMPEIHLKQLGFRYSACGPFTKNKERMQNFEEAGVHNIFIKTKQIKLFFNMTWLIEILQIYLEEQPMIKY